MGAGEGKKARNFRPPHFGPAPFGPLRCGPPFFGPHTSGPPTLWAPTLRAEALRPPTFSGFGPLRSSFYHIVHLFFCAFLIVISKIFYIFHFFKLEGRGERRQTQLIWELLPPKPQTSLGLGGGNYLPPPPPPPSHPPSPNPNPLLPPPLRGYDLLFFRTLSGRFQKTVAYFRTLQRKLQCFLGGSVVFSAISKVITYS